MGRVAAMSLSLPADLEAFTDDYDQLTTGSGVYVLELSKPANPTQAWDEEYDKRPEWFEDYSEASRILYVGASKCVLSRLEDHRDAHDPGKDAVRETVLTALSTDIDLLEVYWYDDADTAFLKESQHALQVDQETEEKTFVRSA